jgi:peptidoglycan-associated lipoprotein
MSALKTAMLAGLLVVSGVAGSTAAQVPPPVVAVDPLKADFLARTGSDVVYFAGTAHMLDASARTTIAAQAQWLLANPAVRVRIEGHSDLADTRDHALAVGMRRADSVRNFLLLNGVPAAQVTAVSFGKERPATNGPGEAMAALNRRAVTVLVR